jgi:pyruvate,water dikinase
LDASSVPITRTKILLTLADPAQAFRLSFLPNSGVGLARTEFIVTHHVGIHPMALAHFPNLNDPESVRQIRERIGNEDAKQYFIRRFSEGVARIAAAFYPKPVIVRTSDFKTNEYAQLLGGREFEPDEENPMLGFRGASRYYHPAYAEGFALECRALARVRNEMGLHNVIVMIPFCRTVAEGFKVIDAMSVQGLVQGQNGLEVYAMCELPSNVVLAADFLKVFDGYSIGSNDLTQLTLGLDRDSATVANLFDENNAAVKRLIEDAVGTAQRVGKPIGICGQAPSDFPDFAEWLVGLGIDSISLNPDTVVKTALLVHRVESRSKLHNR